MESRRCFTAALLWTAALAAGCFASGQQSVALPRGEVIEKVVCGTQPSQTYALYLPSYFTPEKQWPILIAFEPLARGKIPVELFRPAAEKYGYIVVSSNNSQNGPWAPQLEAAQAVWVDTHTRFPIDPRRVYLAGFSGGARLACALGFRLKDRVTGVIACGAGFPLGTGEVPSKDLPFIYFGAVGIRDFNFSEMKELDKALAGLGIVHRVVVFSGGHEWLPAAVAEEAIEWMEIQAMKAGTREKEPALIDSLFESRLRQAQEMEKGGDLAGAYQRYEWCLADFEGLCDVAEVRRKATQMKNSKSVAKALKREDSRERRIASAEGVFWGRYQERMSALESGEGNWMDVRLLIQQARAMLPKSQDAARLKDENIAAQRFVVGLMVLNYQKAEDALAAKDFSRARENLRIAVQCEPESGFMYFQLARACVLSNHHGEALEALEKSFEKGYAGLNGIEKDPDFAPLRDTREFQELVARFGKK
jgi:pimeloyl-ACP methyl ester carboxylesterase